MNENGFEKIEKFSQSKIHQVLVKNGGKILLSVLIVIYAITLISGKNSILIDRLHYVAIGIIVAFVLSNYLLKRYVYEIEINHKSSIITFYLYRGNNSISVKKTK